VIEGFWCEFLSSVGVDVTGCRAVVPTSAVSSKSQTVALLFVMLLEELQSNLRGFAVLSQMRMWKTSAGMVLCFLSSVCFSAVVWKKILQ